MKKYFALLMLCVFMMPAFGAGRSMVSGIRPSGIGVARNAGVVGTSGNNVVNGAAVVPAGNAQATVNTPDTKSAEKSPESARQQEKMTCINNNIGIGNTFVWASRYSNTSNYSTMVEDVEHPENNVCFVLVGIRSEDAAVNTADIQPRYFEWGQNITCGSWVDEEKLKDRILDAKKKGRVWATIGTSVAGAGVGVGMMEAFGNKLIGGKVQGQKAYAEGSIEWYQAKANELKQKNPTEYNNFKTLVAELKTVCNASGADAQCKDSKYQNLMSLSLN